MMKRISFIVLAVLLIGGIAFAATPGFRENPGTGDILGQGKYQSDAHKIFRLVRYYPTSWDGTSTLNADSIVVWNSVTDDGVSVCTTTTSSDSRVAGIIVANALTPDVYGREAADDVGGRNWTWLQTYGYSEVYFAGLVTSAGAAFGTSSTAGEAAMFVPSTTDATKQGKAGFAYDSATAGDDDVQVFLTGLD